MTNTIEVLPAVRSGLWATNIFGGEIVRVEFCI